MSNIKESFKNRAFKEYENYIINNDLVTEYNLFNLSTMQMVGYFLKVHSKEPRIAVNRYLKKNNLTYKKAIEVRLLLSIIKGG